MDLRATIVERLTRRFAPLHLEVRDESARHTGHAGAASGGGHLQVLIVAAAFEGLTLLERHRAVHQALADLMGGAVHALGLNARAPSEWR